MNKLDKTNNLYFLILFSILPVSIIVGPAVSIINIALIALSFINHTKINIKDIRTKYIK